VIMGERSLFRATLRCTLNNLTDSRWPPKSLRSRERHANRGLESWVQNQPRNRASFTVTDRLKLSSSTSSTIIRVALGAARISACSIARVRKLEATSGSCPTVIWESRCVGGKYPSSAPAREPRAGYTLMMLPRLPSGPWTVRLPPYNIVDDSPCEQRMWLTAFARYCGAPEPPHVCEQEALQAAGADAVYYATRLRGASNAKAKRDLGFRPRPLAWLFDTAGTTEG
jgi:hypothetical protein